MLGELEQMVLLAILHLGDGAYGVAVHRLVRERTRRVIAPPTVYATLARLEAKGHLASHVGDPAPRRGGRARRIYTLTMLGRVDLTAALDALEAMKRGLEL